MSVLRDIEKLRNIFLADDVDDDTRTDNEQQIVEWEKTLTENEAMASWQSHDITKELIAQAKRSYVQIAARLATDRSLTEHLRQGLWANQDACQYFIMLGSADAKGEMERVQKEVRIALRSG